MATNLENLLKMILLHKLKSSTFRESAYFVRLKLSTLNHNTYLIKKFTTKKVTFVLIDLSIPVICSSR